MKVSNINISEITESSVNVTINGVTKTLEKLEGQDATAKFSIKGFTGRYQTGGKAWRATLSIREDMDTGENWVDADFGFESHSRKHNKVPTISFA